MQTSCGRGSAVLRRRCATLCTSGCMDDVTFGRNGREARKGRQHSASLINYVRDRGGVWCLWMLIIIMFKRSLDAEWWSVGRWLYSVGDLLVSFRLWHGLWLFHSWWNLRSYIVKCSEFWQLPEEHVQSAHSGTGWCSVVNSGHNWTQPR